MLASFRPFYQFIGYTWQSGKLYSLYLQGIMKVFNTNKVAMLFGRHKKANYNKSLPTLPALLPRTSLYWLQGILVGLAYSPTAYTNEVIIGGDTCSSRCDLIGDVLRWGNIALDVEASEHSWASDCLVACHRQWQRHAACCMQQTERDTLWRV